MGTIRHNTSRHVGTRVRAGLFAASAVYVMGLLMIAGIPLSTEGSADPEFAATTVPPVAPAAAPAAPRPDPRIGATDFIPQLQINGRGITRRPDF